MTVHGDATTWPGFTVVVEGLKQPYAGTNSSWLSPSSSSPSQPSTTDVQTGQAQGPDRPAVPVFLAPDPGNTTANSTPAEGKSPAQVSCSHNKTIPDTSYSECMKLIDFHSGNPKSKDKTSHDATDIASHVYSRPDINCLIGMKARSDTGQDSFSIMEIVDLAKRIVTECKDDKESNGGGQVALHWDQGAAQWPGFSVRVQGMQTRMSSGQAWGKLNDTLFGDARTNGGWSALMPDDSVD